MTYGKWNRSLVVALALIVALAFGASSAVAADEGPVKIGLLAPMSGDLGSFGDELERAASLVVSHVNEQGGILGGRALELVVADDETDPVVGVSEAQRLVHVEGVAGLVGSASSGVTLPVATQVTIPSRVVHLTVATSPQITGLDDDDYVFRTVASDTIQGHVLGSLASRLGYTRVATLYLDNEYGRDLAEHFATSFFNSGGSVVASAPFEPGQASYRDALDQVSGSGAEVLLLISYPESGITILRESLDGGYFDRFLLTDGMQNSSIVAAIGEQLEGAWGTAPSSAEMPWSDVIDALYEARYGPIDQVGLLYETYNAAFLLALAIEKAGETSGPAIRDAIRQVSGMSGEPVLPGEWAKAVQLIREGKEIRYFGAPFPLGFDENGDLNLGTIGMWTIINGKIRVITSERIVAEFPLSIAR